MSRQEAVILDREEFVQMVKNPSFKRFALAESAVFQSANFVSYDDIKILVSAPGYNEDTQSAQTDSLSIDSIIPESAFMLSQNIFTYPIFSLPNHSLRETIQVSIQVNEANKVIIWNDDFGVCGIGDNAEEALQEFEELVFVDYDSLKNIAEKDLSKGAKELLSQYKVYLG